MEAGEQDERQPRGEPLAAGHGLQSFDGEAAIQDLLGNPGTHDRQCRHRDSAGNARAFTISDAHRPIEEDAADRRGQADDGDQHPPAKRAADPVRV